MDSPMDLANVRLRLNPRLLEFCGLIPMESGSGQEFMDSALILMPQPEDILTVMESPMDTLANVMLRPNLDIMDIIVDMDP